MLRKKKKKNMLKASDEQTKQEDKIIYEKEPLYWKRVEELQEEYMAEGQHLDMARAKAIAITRFEIRIKHKFIKEDSRNKPPPIKEVDEV